VESISTIINWREDQEDLAAYKWATLHACTGCSPFYSRVPSVVRTTLFQPTRCHSPTNAENLLWRSRQTLPKTQNRKQGLPSAPLLIDLMNSNLLASFLQPKRRWTPSAMFLTRLTGAHTVNSLLSSNTLWSFVEAFAQ
jgi:hypothetical protein